VGDFQAGGVRVRLVRSEDFDAVAAITNHYILSTAIHFGTEAVTAASLRESWTITAEVYPFVVAELVDDSGPTSVVGYAKAGVWRDRAAYSWTPECGVYVREGWHARGFGRAMYARLFEVMARQGFRSVVAGMTLPNPPSQRLHESMGFVPAGVIRDGGWKLGRWWDVSFWQKSLREGEAGERKSVSQAWDETLQTA